jgi:hypothetical protein
MWLIIVSLLACFDINKAKDEFGNEIEIDHTYMVEGLVTYVNEISSVFWIFNSFFSFAHRHKKPFACSITPRTEVIRELIESTLDS